jgi:hypothetical protein
MHKPTSVEVPKQVQGTAIENPGVELRVTFGSELNQFVSRVFVMLVFLVAMAYALATGSKELLALVCILAVQLVAYKWS